MVAFFSTLGELFSTLDELEPGKKEGATKADKECQLSEAVPEEGTTHRGSGQRSKRERVSEV